MRNFKIRDTNCLFSVLQQHRTQGVWFKIMNNHTNFILGTPQKVMKKRIPSTILSEKEKNPIKAIKLTDEDPKEETFDVVKLGKMTNKKGVVTNTPVFHYCIFCPENAKSPKKITRHWYDCHKNCEEVKEILAITPTKLKLKDLDPKEKSKQMLRTKNINLLKNRGDFR